MILKNHEGQHVSHTLALLEQHQRKKAGASLQSVTDSTRSHLVQYVNEERQTRNASTYKKLQQEWLGGMAFSPAQQPPTESEEPVVVGLTFRLTLAAGAASAAIGKSHW